MTAQSVPEAAACHCGGLEWTVRQHGKVMHKHACPARTDAFCQTHPDGCPDAVSEAAATVRRLLAQHTLSPRPWELIWDTGTGTRIADGEPVEGVIKPDSLRIVDAENRLLVRIQADPEQTLKGEDMQLIVAAVNAAEFAMTDWYEREREFHARTKAALVERERLEREAQA